MPVVSYQTAWLKANHPVEFMAGVMNCDIHLTDKLAVYAEEVRRGLGIEIVPPCVNRSEALFSCRKARWSYSPGPLGRRGGEGGVERARGAPADLRETGPAPAAARRGPPAGSGGGGCLASLFALGAPRSVGLLPDQDAARSKC